VRGQEAEIAGRYDVKKQDRGSFYWRQIPEEWRGALRAEYRKTALDVSAWVAVGDSLMGASQLLRPPLDDWWVRTRRRFAGEKQESPGPPPADAYYMLIGFAAENYLKAALVRRFRAKFEQEIDRDLELPGDLANHGIEALVRKVRVKTDDQELEILRMLESKVLWSGRYPSPRRPSGVALAGHAESWVDRATRLVQRFRDEA
jgi:hypothetical protein